MVNLTKNFRFAERKDTELVLDFIKRDLGDEGLRQAKMTYRPCGFINKYLAYKL